MFFAGIERIDDGIGKGFPTLPLMAARHMGTHRQRGIEQHDTLTCPAREIALLGGTAAEVVLDFPENVDQRGWQAHTVGHGKAQSVSLPRLVVGVLADDDDLDPVERTKIEGVEDELTGWKTGVAGILFTHE